MMHWTTFGKLCSSRLILRALVRCNCVGTRLSSSQNSPRVGIVGSGPAGFYTAQYILKHHQTVCVDIFEKLPVPFGLVRYGVAPDHPEVKNATNTFEEVAANPRFRFFGNINIGKDIKAVDLQSIYNAVVFAYGADDDKKLNIPGEDGEGVIPARSFVGWYNGLPAHVSLSPNFDSDTAVIVGHGNVALDVARILLAPLNLLKHTDICEHAIQALEHNKIKRVILLGRRGPLEVAFTIKELREMIRLDGTKPVLNPKDFVNVREQIPNLPRARRRLIELMCKTALDEPAPKEKAQFDQATKDWHLNYFSSPSEVLLDDSNKVKGIRVEKNELVEENNGNLVAKGTGQTHDIDCGMVLRSIGYKSIPLQEGVPFDHRMGVIPNIEGRVVEEAGSPHYVKGLYCSGWVKHGPVGVIVTTMNEAFATAEKIVEDLHAGNINAETASSDVEFVLREKEINFVSYEDYLRIDQEELWRGKQSSKPREKITSTKEMLTYATQNKKLDDS